MAVSNTKLSILTFPQSWDGTNINLRVLLIPRESPLDPLVKNLPSPGIDAPAFVHANIVLNVHIIGSLDNMPAPADVTSTQPFPVTAPGNSEAIFKELQKQFKITKPSNVVRPVAASTFIQKYLPATYRNSFAFSTPRTPYAKTDDSYQCAMKRPKDGLPPPVYSTDDVSWGKVFAMILRQPALARQVGFIYDKSVPVPAGMLKDGGWIYVDLDGTSDYQAQVLAQPELVKRYAARIPALSDPRSLFAALQFPVSDAPVGGNFDPLFAESEDYDDGFAKIVHCYQPVSANPLLEPGQDGLPPVKDIGIRLGWDDEQLLIWQNRQMIPDPDTSAILDAPPGVLSYRVDVKPTGSNDDQWSSLMKVQGELVLNGIDIGVFDGELGVEAAPTQPDGQKQGVFWLPSYLTQWTGTSLVVKDIKAATLAGTDSILKRQLLPVDDEKVPLQYGQSYDFRVRLADITGGGPLQKDKPVYGAPSPAATCHFRRHVPPRKVRITDLEAVNTPDNPKTTYQVFRPRTGYPELVFTGLPNAYALLLNDLDAAKAEQREPGYFDPDVAFLQIQVDIKAPDMDSISIDNDKEHYYRLFTTTREFPADITQAFALDLQFHDAHVIKFGDPNDFGDLPVTTGSSPIHLPSARDIRINVTAIGKNDPTLLYFASQETRTGKPVAIFTRADSKDETALFVNELPGKQFQSILLQPDPPPDKNNEALLLVSGQSGESSGSLVQRLAGQLELDNNGMTLLAKPGNRVIFGCAKEIRHIISPDHNSISFAAKPDLIRHWIPAIILEINRDWSWDGLQYVSFEIKRNGTDLVGTIEMPPVVPITALKSPVDRSKTRIIFFDAIDPKVFPGPFPEPLDISYTVEAKFKVAPQNQDPITTLSMKLPVAIPPVQVPRVVSAGIALSPYTRTPDYSGTKTRQRVLWFEMAEPVLDPNDAYFVYVKAYAPDPLLLNGNEPVPDPKENNAFIPPELIRVIIPAQSDDKSALTAKQQLIPAKAISPRHFILPLPPGLTYDSRELFGFFTYEVCIGHATVWSTAQARFGRPIRLTGVQHPAPALVCVVSRNKDGIAVTAPFATPVYLGSTLQPFTPKTELWAVLYTQVLQADGKDFRNILLSEKKMIPLRSDFEKQRKETIDLPSIGFWSKNEIQSLLEAMGFAADAPLSVLVVEVMPNLLPVQQPLGAQLGKERIYRTSQLEPVPEICCESC